MDLRICELIALNGALENTGSNLDYLTNELLELTTKIEPTEEDLKTCYAESAHIGFVMLDCIEVLNGRLKRAETLINELQKEERQE